MSVLLYSLYKVKRGPLRSPRFFKYLSSYAVQHLSTHQVILKKEGQESPSPSITRIHWSEAAVLPCGNLQLKPQMLRGNTAALDKLLVHASSNTVQHNAAQHNGRPL